MDTKMDLSEILLWIDLIKKEKTRPDLNELKMMLYFLEDYKQVKEFYNQFGEYKNRLPFKFLAHSLIHFLEDYEDCVELKKHILSKTKRNYDSLFIHQILLCKSQEEAMNIIAEAKQYDTELGEIWASRYDSIWRVKNNQKTWKEGIEHDQAKLFPEMYEEFCEMKVKYFERIPLEQLKQNILKEQTTEVDNRKIGKVSVFPRSVYIKEFAKRVSKGICQLCDEKAPFVDKQGNPFLEVHHIKYLSQKGTDTIDNVVALCPNCHRKIHLLELDEDFKKIKKKALRNMEF
ncbi:HNH endonuclease [Priestia megaterium]|uniref:HNH endonuclease n=1 Tax=Priestia megaterium TaxID=1404 RepID=UPI0023DB6842|nr:HNH endonuclease [Priestia megaterium]MDF2015545.1 HNH endonuclease [Priestia megaterium]